MLKEIIISLTDNIHEIGHHGSVVDHMMDSVSGMGHRIKHGHDMQGLIEAYQLEGIDGIGLWFDHMFKDFTSPHGIPLPFSEAIIEITGMEMDNAIDWLTLNASDVIELGVQEGALYLFRNNKKAYNTTLLIGSFIGFVDDNPSIIIANTMHYLKQLKDNNMFLPILNPSFRFLSKANSVMTKVFIGTAIANVGLGLVGVNLSEMIENTGEMIDGLDLLDISTTIADIVDGAAMFGLGILASKGVKKIAESINRESEIVYERNRNIVSAYDSLVQQLKNQLPNNSTMMLVDYLQKNGQYPKRYYLGDGVC